MKLYKSSDEFFDRWLTRKKMYNDLSENVQCEMFGGAGNEQL